MFLLDDDGKLYFFKLEKSSATLIASYNVLKGIEAAKNAGLLPVKINCVIINSEDEEDARGVTQFCRDNDLEIRYIHQMDLVKGHFSKVIGGIGGDCAVNRVFENKRTTGII
ncbi:MAG: hypothetical protein HGB35_09270 [Geobacteraceae bacterium]|nr:hypothetical protein [Geobacteraceae bacterium]